MTVLRMVDAEMTTQEEQQCPEKERPELSLLEMMTR